jgi:hypothetical protein
MAVTLSYTPQTTLDAVNQMLLSIGKAPVNTLNVPGINDVSFAQTVLHNVNREVQHRGWWFNREPAFPITPDNTGSILIPNTVIDIDTTDRSLNFVERGGKLYDLDGHTFNIAPKLTSGSLQCDVVWFFEFETIPQAARAYIARRAGREFQTSSVGSQVLYQFTKELELDAAAEMNRSDLKNGARNMFATPTRNNRIYNRQPGASRRNW